MKPYTLWLTLAINHGYFGAATCTALQCAPSAATSAVLQRYGLKFRPKKNGGVLYFNDEELLASFDLSMPLIFQLTSDNTSLLNFSAFDFSVFDATLNLGNSLFYVDNRLDTSGTLLPNLNQSVLKVFPFKFSLTPSVTNAALYSVQYSLSNVVVWSGALGSDGALQIDLSTQAEARYSLYADSTLLFTFYASQTAPSQLWGSMALYLGGAAQLPYLTDGCPAITASGIVPQPIYSLNLAARACIWRYRIFSQSPDPHIYDHYQVQGVKSDGTVLYSFTLTCPQQTGGPWIFESQDAIAFAERPQLCTFYLSKTGNAGALRNKIKLQYAEGKLMVLSNPQNPEYAFADIYVFL